MQRNTVFIQLSSASVNEYRPSGLPTGSTVLQTSYQPSTKVFYHKPLPRYHAVPHSRYWHRLASTGAQRLRLFGDDFLRSLVTLRWTLNTSFREVPSSLSVQRQQSQKQAYCRTTQSGYSVSRQPKDKIGRKFESRRLLAERLLLRNSQLLLLNIGVLRRRK